MDAEPYADGVKGLNTKGGRKRYSFITPSDAAPRHALRARDVRASHEASAAPERGAAASFFCEELDRLRGLDVSSSFRSFSSTVAPLCRTLAQLLHHRDAVVGALAAALGGGAPPACWASLCALTGVLARDLREELYPCYDTLVGALRGLMGAGAGAVVAEAFRALGFLFKYLAPALLADARFRERFGEWGGYLGGRRIATRDHAAAALALLLRRAPLAGARAQLLAALRAVGGGGGGGGAAGALAAAGGAGSACSVEEALAGAELAAARARGVDMRDGVARLLFETLRGPGGALHSRGAPLLGQHTREVLREAGFAEAEIGSLFDEGAAAEP